MSVENIGFPIPKRFDGKTSSVWNDYAQLYNEYKPISLGHGYADYVVTKYFNDVLAEVAANADNSMTQYTRAFGHLRLVKALSVLYAKVVGRDIDPYCEVLVTSGAMQALFSVILGNIDDGDEVIIIEPFFDAYEPIIQMAGGKVRYVQLKLTNEWNEGVVSSASYVLDDNDLRSAFNEKTKMIIMNTPNNPLGKIYNREELLKIAKLCQAFNVICVSDEVYEWVDYGETELVRICSLPGMWERTITIGSAGKTFSVTGWRTGWAYGSAALIKNMILVHTNVVYACPTPLQEALGIIFEREIERFGTSESFFKTMSADLKKKRDYMVHELRAIGMKVVIPQGGYFMIADWTNLEVKTDLSSELDELKDFRFTKWLTKNVGVMGIPPTVFLNEKHKPAMECCVRFCFFKQNGNLQEAIDRLKKFVK